MAIGFRFLTSVAAVSTWLCLVPFSAATEPSNTTVDRLPNIVYIMSDELAYFELGHMGNTRLRTPNIDQFAKEGIRFTNALAGSPVCAPLRCNLMTGRHAGHASVRANDGGTPLRADEATIASLLKSKGYATGGFGKWGCGGRGSTGVPESHGFDEFFGYYDQVHAHSFYPAYLIRNSDEVALPGNEGGRSGETYSHYEIMKRGLDFIREHREEPFFCYLPITPPHGMYDIPSDDPAWDRYRDDAWMQDPEISQEIKNYAAMVTMVDDNVGQVLSLLQELGLEDNTIVFFTGDNGGQDRFKSKQYPRGFFGPNVDPKTGVEFRGGKGNLYEGGLKIPYMARWPGRIPAGQVSDLVFYHPDVLPTLCELAGVAKPGDVDGMSILPELLGSEAVGREQEQHEFLYWEFGQQTAVRIGDLKGVRSGKDPSWKLYDLGEDPSETKDVADQHPEMVQRMMEVAKREHAPVDAGTYSDPQRRLHEKDRKAKWGTRQPAPRHRGGQVFRLDHERLILPEALSVVAASSQNRANNKLAKYAADGDPMTLWHTEFSDGPKRHPHEIVLDVGHTRRIEGIQYLARQDSGWNGAFGKVELFVSDDADEFPEQPFDSHTFEKERRPQTWILDEVAQGRFIKIRILSEVNGGPWASANEIGVIEAKP